MGQLVADPRQAVRPVAGIAAGDDLHPELVRANDRVSQPRQHVLAADAQRRHVVVAARLHDVDDRGVGRIEIGAALFHQRQRRVGQVGPVLDAAHAGLDRRHRALVAVRVRLDRDVPRRRLLDDRADFLLGVDLLARVGVGRPGAIGRQNLDPVDAVRQVHLHGAPQRRDRGHARHQVGVRRIGEKRLLRDSRPHVVAGGDHVGAGDGAGLHQLMETDVRIAGDTGAPHGRHARFERPPERREVGGMCVGVDQARQHVLAFEIEDARAGRRGARSNRLNLAAPDRDRGVRRDAPVADIDEVGVDEQQRFGRGFGRRLRAETRRKTEDDSTGADELGHVVGPFRQIIGRRYAAGLDHPALPGARSVHQRPVR